MANKSTSWPEARVVEIRRLCALRPRPTFREIGERLGITTHQAAGWIYRHITYAETSSPRGGKNG